MDQQLLIQQKANFSQALQIIITPIQGNNAQQKDTFKLADKYIVKFQKTKDAWVIPLLIMKEPDHQQEIYFHCAKIIKDKLQYDFDQLEQQNQQQIFIEIIQFIQNFKQAQRALRGQLCLSFIYCYIHQYETLGDIMELLQKYFFSDSLFTDYIFSILEMLPQEIDNEDVVMDAEKRNKLKNYFSSQIQYKIINSLNILGQKTEDSKQLYQLLKCFRNWNDYADNPQLLSLYTNHSLLNLSFKSLENEELQQKACDCIISAISQIADFQKQPQLFQLFAQQIFSYFQNCNNSIQQNLEDNIESYTKVFVAFGRKIVTELLQNISQEGIKFLEQMVIITKFDKIDNSEDINDFWHKFLKYFKKFLKIPEFQQKQQQFQPLLLNLLDICISRMRYAPEHFVLYNKLSEQNIDNHAEEYEKKTRERQNMKQIITEISEIIILKNTIICIAQQISIQFNQINEQQQQKLQLNIQPYINLEAGFAAVGSILQDTEKRSQEEQNYAIQMVQQAINISNNESNRLRRTILTLINHTHTFNNNSQILTQIFSLISSLFENQFLDKMAFDCFQVLCENNTQFVAENINNFMELFKKYYQQNNVLVGITVTISSKPELLQQYLNIICQQYCFNLGQFLQKQQSDQKEDGQVFFSDMSDQIDKLTIIIRNIPQVESGHPHEIIVQLYKEIWPVLKYLMQTFPGEEKLIEQSIRNVKHTMRCLEKDFDVFLQDLAETIVNAFQLSMISSYLYIVEIIVTVFSKYESKYLNIIQIVYQTMTNLTITKVNKDQDLDQDPHLIEDFFGMQARIVKYSPQFFINSDQLSNIIQFSVKCIGVQHTQAAKSLYTFLEWVYVLFDDNETDQQSFDKQIIYQLLITQNYSLVLIKQLFQELKKVPRQTVREYTYDIFLVQMNLFPKESQQWFSEALSFLDNDIITSTEKVKLINLIPEVCQSKSKKEQMHEILIQIGQRFKLSSLREQTYSEEDD